nr:AAA family ATPase [Desulforamulus hydrothermalis]
MVKIRMWQNLPRPEATKPVGPVRKTSFTGKQLNSQDKTPLNEEASRKATQEILGELDQLIGLSSVKKLVKEIQAFVEIQKLRQKEKLIYEPMVLHMIFKGNPGTGKTTVARIIGRLFKEMGVLPKGHLIEVERADLVGEYIGHTAAKTRDQIKKALGGILFIDEAYSLARGGEKDFGKEAIDSMVASMENNKDNLIIILAGYQEEMNYFLETNPGLRSRFPIHITFPDYSLEELMEIADLMLKQRQYVLSPPAREELYKILQYQTVKHEHSGNARLVRNLIERAMRHQAVRLVGRKNITREDLMTIYREDLTEAVEEI